MLSEQIPLLFKLESPLETSLEPILSWFPGKKREDPGKKPGGKSAPINNMVDKPGKNYGNREKSGKGIILKCS